MHLTPWTDDLAGGPHQHHIVHFDTDRRLLLDAAAAWLQHGLTQGGGGIVLARAASIDPLLRTLDAQGLDAQAAKRQGRLAVLDADHVISRAGPAHGADGAAFHALLHDAISGVERACGPGAPRLRAWGEMVDILRGRSDAEGARQVECWWDEILARRRVDLLCSYTLAAADLPTSELTQICASHDGVIHGAERRPLDTRGARGSAPGSPTREDAAPANAQPS